MYNTNTHLDGNDLLNDAYAIACTDNPEARDICGAWVPSDSLTDYDLENAASEAATDSGSNGGGTARALLEMCLEVLDDDPIWQELEEAAGRALRRFAEDMDEEARHYLGDEEEDEA